MWIYGTVKMWYGENVNMRTCEHDNMWQCDNVMMWSCDNVKIWKCRNVKMLDCDNGKMWNCESIKIWNCEWPCHIMWNMFPNMCYSRLMCTNVRLFLWQSDLGNGFDFTTLLLETWPPSLHTKISLIPLDFSLDLTRLIRLSSLVAGRVTVALYPREENQFVLSDLVAAFSASLSCLVLYMGLPSWCFHSISLYLWMALLRTTSLNGWLWPLRYIARENCVRWFALWDQFKEAEQFFSLLTASDTRMLLFWLLMSADLELVTSWLETFFL